MQLLSKSPLCALSKSSTATAVCGSSVSCALFQFCTMLVSRFLSSFSPFIFLSLNYDVFP